MEDIKVSHSGLYSYRKQDEMINIPKVIGAVANATPPPSYACVNI